MFLEADDYFADGYIIVTQGPTALLSASPSSLLTEQHISTMAVEKSIGTQSFLFTPVPANPQPFYATAVQGSLSASENDWVSQASVGIQDSVQTQSIAPEQNGPGSPFMLQEVAFLPLKNQDNI